MNMVIHLSREEILAAVESYLKARNLVSYADALDVTKTKDQLPQSIEVHIGTRPIVKTIELADSVGPPSTLLVCPKCNQSAVDTLTPPGEPKIRICLNCNHREVVE